MWHLPRFFRRAGFPRKWIAAAGSAAVVLIAASAVAKVETWRQEGPGAFA
jgi:hypothetical protein